MGIVERIKSGKLVSLLNVYIGLFSFIFCIAPKLVTPYIVGLTLFVIIAYARKKLTFQFSWPALFFVLFYLSYLVGTFFTNHKELAFKYLEYKLSFLLFPLILSFRYNEIINLKACVKGLIAGVILASVLGMLHSFQLYQKTADFNNSFGSVRFSYIHHPSYFSVFLIFALSAAWYGYFQQWKGFNRWTLVPFSIFILIMEFFCFSLAGMLFQFLVGIVVYFYVIFYQLKKWVFLIAILSIPCVSILFYTSNRHVKIEVDGVWGVLNEFVRDPVKYVKEKNGTSVGSEVRAIMWVVSFQEFMDHPFGVGTGNVDEHLAFRLNQYNQKELALREYNPHNQFLQTGLEIGVVGLLILCLLMVSLIRFASNNKNVLMLILVSSLMFNSLFESMLQRQSGIVFYTFWICILIVYSNRFDQLHELKEKA